MAEITVRHAVVYEFTCPNCENRAITPTKGDVFECPVCNVTHLTYILEAKGLVKETEPVKKEAKK